MDRMKTMRSIWAAALLCAGAAGCAGANVDGQRGAPAQEPTCLPGEALLPSDGEAPVLWADSPGIVEGAPTKLDLPLGYAEVEASHESLWIGTLRQRGGEVYLPRGRSCQRLELEPDTTDQGWMTSDHRLESGETARRDVRYAFRHTTTGFLDGDNPGRSKTVTQVILALDGAYYRADGPGRTGRLLRAHRCHDTFRVVAADDHRLLVIRGDGDAAVRAYPENGVLALYLNAAECERSIPRPPG